MVVKYLTNGFQEGWEFISDVTSFKYSEISEKQRKGVRKNCTCINDYISRLDEDGKIREEIKDYIYFRAWHKNQTTGKSIEIITNMSVYLLNDDGKIIERIH